MSIFFRIAVALLTLGVALDCSARSEIPGGGMITAPHKKKCNCPGYITNAHLPRAPKTVTAIGSQFFIVALMEPERFTRDTVPAGRSIFIDKSLLQDNQ